MEKHKRMLLIFLILSIFLISLGPISANENIINQTNTNETLKTNINLLNAPISPTNPSVTFYAYDVYNESSNTYDEEGILVSDVNFQIFDLEDNLILTGISDKYGTFSTNSLDYGTYKLQASYLTYKPITMNFNVENLINTIDVRFIPDICLLMSYTSHSEKINVLMNISRRVYYIDTYPYELEKEWLLDYANYIQLDMFAEGSYRFETDIIIDSPANKNHLVAYTFGVYNSTFLDTLNINFIGAADENNTPDTIENTYIGSYFQAFDINNLDVLKTNMENLYEYILYLMGDINTNPTLNTSKTPLVDASLGFYHPDLGKICFQPSQELVNSWIIKDPGYNKDGVGSLNWMYVEYKEWQDSNSNPLDLFKQYDNWYTANKPNLNNSYVVIVSYYPGGNLIDTMIRKYESQNRSVLNIYQSVTSPSIASVLTIIANNSDKGISAINSLYDWSMDYENSGNGGAIDEYVQIGVDVIKTMYGVSKASYTSEYGPQAEWTYSVSIPSFEGVYGAVLCSYNNEYGEEVVIDGGVNQLVENTLGWVNLREKENANKKIAVILWDYPPGKGHIGASYLDIFSSIHDLLIELDKEGYDIGGDVNSIPNTTELYTLISESANKGPYAQGLLNQYVEKYYDRLIENNQLVDYEEYLSYVHTLNETLQNELIEYWGEGLGLSMVYNDTYLVIPGITFGNILITFQPSRGWDSVEEYHSAYLPPPQHYVAFYKWLKYNYQADALINLGTHGTLEFLPGRPLGLQEDDWPLALTNIPTIYPYIVSNPGEAMTARERIAALLITHMTPATVLSELYGNLTTLKTYISNYETAIKTNSTDLAASYEVLILNLSRELAYSQPKTNQSFEDWLEELDEELEDLSNDIVTIGLHTIGVELSGDELIQELITITASRTSIYDYILWKLYPNLKEEDIGYYDILHNTNYTTEIDEAQILLENIVTDLTNSTYEFTTILSKYNITSSDSELIECLLFLNETMADLVNNTEWESIIAALNGQYILPNLMADPSYSDSLPTGRNPYAYDTTKMPSKAAWETAKLIDDKLIVDYYEKYGEFPELLGLIMWGTELLRTEGIGIAQFLYLLGVTPTWSQTETITGIKLLPLDSLKVTLSNGTVIQRPRIDVYASIVTQNADWIGMLINAVKLVYEGTPGEGTDVNMVKKHYEENPSLDRLFGLQGAVLEGTGMADYIPNTDRWQNDTNMAATLTNIYLSRVSYAWTVDAKGQIAVNKKTSDYEYLLKNVDVISQNIDSTWRFLDSDDYYDWFGGMLGASQYLGGRPETAVADIRNKHDINIRTLDEELDFEIRSTVINPKVRDSLLGDNPSGWQTYASKYDFIFGFSTVAHKTTEDGSLDNLISNNMFDALGENAIYMGEMANADYKAVSFQTSAAWMIYSYDKGYWKGDTKTVTKLVDQYVQSVVQYGFACCHHTCANLDFNNMIMQLSSLDPTVKQQYADIYEQATLNKIYTNASSNTEPQENPNSAENTNQGDSSSQSSSQTADSSSSSSASSSNGGSSSNVGDKQSSDSNDDSGSDSTSGESSSENTGEAYEISTSQPSSQSEGSMPAVIIGTIVGVLLIFGFGYTRSGFSQGKSGDNLDDFDDEDY